MLRQAGMMAASSGGSGWQGVIDETKLPAIDLTTGCNFGDQSRISDNGNYIVVSSQGDSVNGSDAGACYVFVRSGSTWSQQAKLFSSDIQALDFFGGRVDISANASYIISTAINEDGGAGSPLSNAGAAYIFYRTGSSWTQQAKIVSSDLAAGDLLGENCCINADGTYAVVVSDAKAVGGAAYVFKRSGSTWSQEAKLIASNPTSGDLFGFNLAINSDGTYLAVSAPNEDTGGSNSGMVYVFSRSGSTWTQEAQIQSSPVSSSDVFGKALAFNDEGDVLAVGAFSYDDTFTNEGSVLIYTRSGTTWTQQQRIGASVKSASQYFGAAIDMDSSGDIIAITADGDDGLRGAVYVFSKNGGTYTETTKLVASDTYAGQRLGGNNVFSSRQGAIGVSSNGGDIVVGASLDDGAATDAGTAYVFSASGFPSPADALIGSVSFYNAFSSHNSVQVSTTATLNSGYAGRQIWVVVPTMSVTGGGTTGATSATVGGNAMTLHRRVDQTAVTNSVGIAWFKYTDNGSLGTSASVVVNFGSTQIHSGMIVFDSTEATVETDFYGVEGAGNLADGAINTSANGWAAYCSITQNGSAGTQNDFGNILSFDAGTNEWVVFGYNSPASGGAQTIVDDPTGFATSRNAFCGLAMEP